MMGWDGWGGFGLGGIFSLIFMAGFWILIVVGVVLVVRALTAPRQGAGAPPPHASSGSVVPPPEPSSAVGSPVPARPEALRILEERYARGEIEREEFLQRKADLVG